MAEASGSGVENDNAGGIVESYATNYLRVSKDNMFMILALWMEDLPVDEVVKEDPCRKVGAVLVLPNDIAWAADCSRDGVHAVARLLVKHRDKAKGCKMFMSRKPCRICAKLLVQSKVERVLYLPLEPEYYRSPEDHKPETEINTDSDKKSNNTHMKQVDNLFTASPIAQTKFVLQVEKSVLAKKENETPIKEEEKKLPEKIKNDLIKKYNFEDGSKWLDAVNVELPWPAFDNEMKKQVQKHFAEVMEWMGRVRISSGVKDKKDKDGKIVKNKGKIVKDFKDVRGLDYEFIIPKDLSNEQQSSPDGVNQTVKDDSTQEMPAKHEPPFDPVNNPLHKKQAKHFIEMARFIAERTDDPTTAVGAVIVSKKMEILSLGWNGFPLKAHYGEFPRASKDDDAEDNKFSYVIHAEQNALMMRNSKNIEGAIMFVTKSPCDECAPLIAMEGIETVIVDGDVKYRDQKKKPKQDKALALPALGYNEFLKMGGKFICFQTCKVSTGEDAKRKLDYESTSQQRKQSKTE